MLEKSQSQADIDLGRSAYLVCLLPHSTSRLLPADESQYKIVACDKFASKRTRRSNPQNMPHYAPTNHSHAADAVVYWGEFLEYRLVQVPVPVVPVGM